MSFWSTQTLKQRLPELIRDYSEEQLDNAAYDLRLGSEIYISPLPDDTGETRNKIFLDYGRDIDIPPGRFAFLLTEEIIKIPEDALAFISLKFRKKAKGLVNVSGFHVDPGYSGKLVFTVFNAGGSPVKLERGEKIFSIWYSDLDTADEKPYSKKGYSGIPAALIDTSVMGESMSIPQLQKKIADQSERLEKLEQRIWKLEPRTVIIFAILTAVTLFILNYFIIKPLLDSGSNKTVGVTSTVINPSRQSPPEKNSANASTNTSVYLPPEKDKSRAPR